MLDSSENSFIAKRVPLAIPSLLSLFFFVFRAASSYIIHYYRRDFFLPRAVRPVHGSEKASPRLRRNGRSSNATHLWCGAALAREGATVRDYLSPSMENRDGCVPCFYPTVKKGKKRWIGNLSSSLSPLLIAGQFYWTHDT